MKPLSEIVASLVQSHQLTLHFLAPIKKYYSTSISTACVRSVKGKIQLIVNPDFFSKFTEEQQRKILIHEVLHIASGHLSVKINRNINVAMDITINQMCGIEDELKSHSDFKNFAMLSNLREKLPEENIEANQNWQYYLQFIEKLPDGGAGSTLDEHEQMDEQDREQLERAVKQAYERTNNRGQLGAGLEESINALGVKKRNWKQMFRQIVSKSGSLIEKKTRMKTHKRLGDMFRGTRTQTTSTGVIILDTSGSMGDVELGQCLSEFNMLHSSGDYTLYLLQADTSVTLKPELYKRKSSLTVRGRGGTLYQPAIEEAMRLNPDFIVYAGDGDCADKPTDPGVPFVWLMTPGRSKPADFGKEVVIEI